LLKFVGKDREVFTMTNWQEGNRVFVYWDEDEYYYPATVTGVEAEEIHIRYDNDEEDQVSDDYLIELSLYEGDAIECYWSEDDDYYAATIKQVDGERIQVEWEDGSDSWTTISDVRVWYGDEEEEDEEEYQQ
jgi:hypothetical protein